MNKFRNKFIFIFSFFIFKSNLILLCLYTSIYMCVCECVDQIKATSKCVTLKIHKYRMPDYNISRQKEIFDYTRFLFKPCNFNKPVKKYTGEKKEANLKKKRNKKEANEKQTNDIFQSSLTHIVYVISICVISILYR